MFESYYNRALQSSDPRYRKIFEAMGYGKRDAKKAAAAESPREAATETGKGKSTRPKKDAPLQQAPAPQPEPKPEAKAETAGDE